MADRTDIEWTDATWNPVRGCTRVSEGCRNCYAEGVAARFSGPGQPFHGLATRTPSGPRWTGKVEVAWHLLELPLRWRQPRRIFVNSMSDLFHEAMDQEEIATIFAMAVAAVQAAAQARAALALVPVGWVWCVSTQTGDQIGAWAGAGRSNACTWEVWSPDEAKAATPALALCIAALRARMAAQEAGDG